MFVEIRCRRYDGITGSTCTLTGVAVAETRSTSKFVLHVQVEIPRSTFPTMSAFDVFFARANSVHRITGWSIIEGASGVTVARLTTVRAKVEEIILTTVALLASHTRFTLTLALGIALQGSRTNRITAAVDAVTILAHEEILLATLTIRSVSVRAALRAVPAVSGEIVQLTVEEAFG